MRDFLNAILAFIGAESLTDDEFDSVENVTVGYIQDVYDDLSRVLISREAVSVLHTRLINYFEARGVTVTPTELGSTNIFIGGVLE